MSKLRVAGTTAILVLMILWAPSHADELPAKQFANPDRIRYDSECLTIDGQDCFIFSGAFHYFRTPKELWRDRFAKIKAAGFNAVETYVPWNWSEQQMPNGVDDLSQIKLDDLREWMKMAHDEFGLYTIIRPGPYICAEWLGGGFPQWLWSKQPAGYESKAWLRTDDPVYLAWTRHWMNAVWPVIAKEQITRKPRGSKGVILVQIENEYDLFGGVPDGARVKQLHVLYEDAVKCGIDVPIFTCLTRQARGSRDPLLSQVFDASNYYHRWNLRATANSTKDVLAKQPNAPAMISELQGGWFSEAGGRLAEDQDDISAAQCNAITLTAIANGATILNYYMLVGGSNFGQWGGGSMLQTYDYNAPIRETGGATEKYAMVKSIGAFLKDFGTAVARAKPVGAKVITADTKVEVTARRDAAGRLYLFCRSEKQQMVNCDVQVDDGPTVIVKHRFPAKIMTVLVLPPGSTQDSDGRWTCEPDPLPERPEVANSVRVTSAWTREEPGPTRWRPINPGQSLIQAGVYDAGDVTYLAEPVLTTDQVAAFGVLSVGNDATAARMVLRVNGSIMGGRRVGKAIEFQVGDLLQEGRNHLELVYQNHGVGNFGDALNVQPGVTSLALVGRGGTGKPVKEWRVSLITDNASHGELAAGFDDSSWDPIVLDDRSFSELSAAKQPGAPPLTYPAMALLNGRRATSVYRSTFDLTASDVAKKATRFEIGGVDDSAELFINGKTAGTWSDFRRPFVANISGLVCAGKNTVAVAVKNDGGDGGITKPVFLYTERSVLPLKCVLGTDLLGVAERWWENAAGVGWTQLELDGQQTLPPKGALAIKPAAAVTLRKWVRADFELPAAKPGIWAPWGAIIHASGDGFVYLNGHELGRYYNEGPQRRFYLPECWLDCGHGRPNVLTMLLNASDGEPGLLGLEIAPFADQVEAR